MVPPTARCKGGQRHGLRLDFPAPSETPADIVAPILMAVCAAANVDAKPVSFFHRWIRSPWGP